MATRPVTVNDVLHGHVVLDLESFDRIYLNGYVPSLQVGRQVVSFLTRHLGFPIPSPALLEKIGNRFRLAVRRFAADHDVPVVRFGKGDRKLDVMRPHLDRLAAQGRCGVAAIGVAQEFQRVFTATTEDRDGPGAPHFRFAKADRRVIAYYFCVVDEAFGPAFVKRRSPTTPAGVASKASKMNQIKGVSPYQWPISQTVVSETRGRIA